MTHWRAVLLWGTASASTAACVADGNRSETSTAIQVAVMHSVRGIDPRYSLEISEGVTNGLVFESLAERDSLGMAIPWLARRWMSDDSLTWTFRLHPDVRFHDGTRLRAADVVRSWTTLLRDSVDGDDPPSVMLLIRGAPDVRARRARNIDGLIAVDDTTLRIELTQREPNLPRTLGSRRLGVTAASSRRWAPVGTGPWRFARRASGDSVLHFSRFRDYWAGPAQQESLLVRVVPVSQIASAFAGGLIDCANDIDEPQAARLVASRAVRLQSLPRDNRGRIVLNFAHNGLRDIRVRRALLLALDRRAISSSLAATNVLPSDNVVPDDLVREPPRELTAYDPDSARRLLNAAGFDLTHPLTMRLPATPLIEPFEHIGVLLAEYWRAIGVQVVSDGARGDDSPRTRAPADAEIWIEQPGVRTVEEYLNTVMIESPFGHTAPLVRWDSPRFRSLYATARSTRDSVEREAARRDMLTLLRDSLPTLPLFFVGDMDASSLRVSSCDERMPRYARSRVRQ